MSPISMAAVGASSKPSAWRPTNLGGPLVAWYDADDASTFTEVSGKVSQWRDKSASGWHLDQSNATYRPIRVANTLNGRSVVDFTSDFLLTNHTYQQPVTHYFVIKQDSHPAFQRLWNGGIAGIELIGGVTGLYSGTSLQRGTASLSPRLHITYSNSGSSEIWIDGTKQGTSGNAGSLTNATPQGYYMGATRTSLEWFTDGYVAEWITVTGSMVTGERQRIEGYLANKWGLTANLPAGHPYKSVAP